MKQPTNGDPGLMNSSYEYGCPSGDESALKGGLPTIQAGVPLFSAPTNRLFPCLNPVCTVQKAAVGGSTQMSKLPFVQKRDLDPGIHQLEVLPLPPSPPPPPSHPLEGSLPQAFIRHAQHLALHLHRSSHAVHQHLARSRGADGFDHVSMGRKKTTRGRSGGAELVCR